MYIPTPPKDDFMGVYTKSYPSIDTFVNGSYPSRIFVPEIATTSHAGPEIRNWELPESFPAGSPTCRKFKIAAGKVL